MLYKLWMLLLLVTITTQLGQAQSLHNETIANAGASFNNGNHVLTWTAGELVVEPMTGSNGSLAHGQTAGLISIISATTTVETSDWDLRIFPNPAQTTVHIEMPNAQTEELSYTLVNALGQVVQTAKIETSTTSISLAALPEGIYWMSFYNANNKAQKTYKLQKH